MTASSASKSQLQRNRCLLVAKWAKRPGVRDRPGQQLVRMADRRECSDQKNRIAMSRSGEMGVRLHRFPGRKRKFRFEDSRVIFMVLTLESTWNIVR